MKDGLRSSTPDPLKPPKTPERMLYLCDSFLLYFSLLPKTPEAFDIYFIVMMLSASSVIGKSYSALSMTEGVLFLFAAQNESTLLWGFKLPAATALERLDMVLKPPSRDWTTDP